MPTTIFDWIARTAMLAMAGLVTLSILGAIAAMTNDPGTRFAAPGGRPVIEGERAEEREQPRASPQPGQGNPVEAAQAGGPGGAAAETRPAPEEKEERWLEAIAYALLALAGIGALGVLMLWNVVRELRRIGGQHR
ncbi:MAG TPA: hypothetical protein VF620_07055 [Allosphingosinicella sp.]|jgi:hypothetical protein